MDCKCQILETLPVQYDNSACPTHGPDAPRYFVDHWMIHDKDTGRHVTLKDAIVMLNAPLGSCPCVHTTPCHDRCTCIMSFSSSGCHRCCTYGSDEQQRAMAEHLAKMQGQNELLTACAESTVVDIGQLQIRIDELERDRDMWKQRAEEMLAHETHDCYAYFPCMHCNALECTGKACRRPPAPGDDDKVMVKTIGSHTCQKCYVTLPKELLGIAREIRRRRDDQAHIAILLQRMYDVISKMELFPS